MLFANLGSSLDADVSVIFGQKLMTKSDFACQNAIFVLNQYVKKGSRMSKCVIRGPNSNVKIGFRIAKCDIRPQYQMTKYDFKLSKCDIRPEFRKSESGFRMWKFDIRPELECQNKIFGSNSNGRMRYSVPVLKGQHMISNVKCKLRPQLTDKIEFRMYKHVIHLVNLFECSKT